MEVCSSSETSKRTRLRLCFVPSPRRLPAIAKLYEARQKTTKEALEALKGLIAEANEAKEEAKTGLSTEVFTICWLFKTEGIPDPEAKASQMSQLMEQYPYWKSSADHQRKFKQELYKILIKSGYKVLPAKDLSERIMTVLA